MGSGRELNRDYDILGKDVFVKKILFECSSEEEIVQKITDRVISLVNSNPSCNLGLSFSMPLIPVYHSLVFDYNTNKTNYSNVRTYNLSEFISSSPLK